MAEYWAMKEVVLEEKKYIDKQFAALRWVFAEINRNTEKQSTPFDDAQFRLIPDNDSGQAGGSSAKREQTPEQMLNYVLTVVQPQLGGTIVHDGIKGESSGE